MIDAAFHTLDYGARVARLDRLARAALEAFGLPDATAHLLIYENNAVYQVTDGADRYALRIHRPGHKHPAWVESELAWLAALHRDGVCVPQPVRSLYSGRLEGVTGSVPCALFRWLEGNTYPAAALTAAQGYAIGAFLARLHESAARFMPPPGFSRPRLDWEGLFGQESVYNPGPGAALFTAEQQAVIAAVTAQVRAVMDALGDGPDVFGLIHADLLAKNILFDGEAVCALDFDECAYGYTLYDLAPLLWGARMETNYAALRDALWAGYVTARPRSARQRDHLDSFIAARHVASCRWIAGNAGHPALRGRAAEIIAGRIEEMRRYLQTGHLWSEGR